MEFLKRFFIILFLIFIISIFCCYSYLQVISKEKTIKVFEIIGSNKFFFRKLIGHLLVNLGLSFMIVIFLYLLEIQSKKIVIINIIFGLFLSFLFEFLQLLGDGRVFSLQDIIINYSGYVIISIIVKGCRVILLK